ncbi:MAG TPA: hypothetical protein PKN62_02285 [bacterium]|nr:hypothetical protein [bacterium]
MNKHLKLFLFGLSVAIIASLIEPFISRAEITGTAVNGPSKTANVNEINYQAEVPIPGFDTKDLFSDNSISPIAKLIKALYKYLVQIVTLLALIVVIIGGFMWSTAGGSKQRVGEAQQWIKAGLGGLLLTLFAFVILRTINVKLVELDTGNVTSVSRKIITGKSDQNQVIDDYGFLDHYYSFPPIGNNPTKEACCVAYDENFFAADQAHFASILYSDDPNIKETAKLKCQMFTNHLYNTTKAKFVNISVWMPEIADTIFKSNCPGDTSVCYSVFYDFACWDPKAGSFINKAAKGKDSTSFCQGRKDGTSCILTNKENKRLWGYCQSGACKVCVNYEASCNKDYQCPDEGEAIGKSDWILNWKCGDKESNVEGNCKSGKCSCEHSKCK